MAFKNLSGDDVAFGRAVLLATDALGVSAEGAFWLYDSMDKQWNFYLITSLFDQMGSREIYLHLNATLKKILSEHEINGFTFYLGSPRENIVKAIKKCVSTGIRVSDPIRQSFLLDGRRVKVVVYRLSNSLNDEEVRRAQRRFRQQSRELLAA